MELQENKWKDTDLAYLAGFIDGEGSIAIFHSGKRYHLRFDIYNTNETVLVWIKEKFEGKIHRVGRAREGNKQEYVWAAGQQRAAIILTACLPYLLIKKRQAEIFIDYTKTSKGRAGMSIPIDMIAYRLDLTTQIQLLNKRGN